MDILNMDILKRLNREKIRLCFWSAIGGAIVVVIMLFLS